MPCGGARIPATSRSATCSTSCRRRARRRRGADDRLHSMQMRGLLIVLAACGSTSPPAVQPEPAPRAAIVKPVVDERARHDELAAAHRKLEDEQSTALAATCDASAPPPAPEACAPSCYPREPADARAGKK